MFFKRGILLFSILSFFTSQVHSLEIREPKEILNTINTQGYDLSILFSRKSQKDPVFGQLLSKCQEVGIDKCYDTIIDWLKKTNIMSIDSIELPIKMIRFINSPINKQYLNDYEINSLKNISYLNYIYASIKTGYCNKKACRKVRDNSTEINREKEKINEQVNRQKNRDEKYSSKYF